MFKICLLGLTPPPLSLSQSWDEPRAPAQQGSSPPLSKSAVPLPFDTSSDWSQTLILCLSLLSSCITGMIHYTWLQLTSTMKKPHSACCVLDLKAENSLNPHCCLSSALPLTEEEKARQRRCTPPGARLLSRGAGARWTPSEHWPRLPSSLAKQIYRKTGHLSV